MMSSLCPAMNSCTISAMCCTAPGFSGDNRLRTKAKNSSMMSATRICMATKSAIGFCGSTGWILSACSNSVVGPAKNLFRSAVNQSCSCIPQPYGRILFAGAVRMCCLIDHFEQECGHYQKQPDQYSFSTPGRTGDYNRDNDNDQRVTQEEPHEHCRFHARLLLLRKRIGNA